MSTDGRMDRRMDKVKSVFSTFKFVEAEGIIKHEVDIHWGLLHLFYMMGQPELEMSLFWQISCHWLQRKLLTHWGLMAPFGDIDLG